MLLSDDAPNQIDPGSSGDPVASLVEVGGGMAVLFADRPPSDVELIPFRMMGSRTKKGLVDGLALGSGLANVAVQGAQSAAPVQGLVRLAPQTLEALKTAAPVQSGGWNLGVLATDGKFSHVVRWAPATSVQATTMLSGLGPALVLLEFQVQLAAISRKVDENVELTRGVLKELHRDHWDTLLGLHETTIKAIAEAQDVGFVNDHIYEAVKTRQADLQTERRVFSRYVKQHVKALAGDAKNREEYLRGHGEEIIADVHGLLMAEGSWFRSQVLRAGHIIHDEEHAEENRQLLTRVVEETREEHDKAMESIAGLLTTLERQARLVAALSGKRLNLNVGRGAGRDIIPLAEALADRVAALRGCPRLNDGLLQPVVAVFRDATVPADLLQILQCVLPEGTRLLALADANDMGRVIHGNVYLGVTSDHLFISPQGVIDRQGVIEQWIPLDDIRYVRRCSDKTLGTVVDIITKDENIQVSFDSWAQEGERLEGVRRLGDLLASTMHIPDSELCSDPLLPELVTPRRQELSSPGPDLIRAASDERLADSLTTDG